MIYFDNAATTFPKPQEMHSFMSDFIGKMVLTLVGATQHGKHSKQYG